MSTLKYKDYLGSSEVSTEDHCLHGKIMFIRDLVTYEAKTVKGLEEAFQAAVDDYLETCITLGKDPDKPFTGTFQIRVGPQMHRDAAMAAKIAEISLNEWVGMAISEKLEVERKTRLHETHPQDHLIHELQKLLSDTAYARTPLPSKEKLQTVHVSAEA
jgi:predicted HicB family RNase H-like nuclease